MVCIVSYIMPQIIGKNMCHTGAVFSGESMSSGMSCKYSICVARPWLLQTLLFMNGLGYYSKLMAMFGSRFAIAI